jgi:nanoRNase/pAp phosphatase (c-di-AMP/oligoRNAs hydrolase)
LKNSRKNSSLPTKTELQKVARALKKARSFQIIVHKCPDPDAAGAAVALCKLLSKQGKHCRISAKGDSISRSAQVLLKKTGYTINDKPDYDSDCIIVMDTNSPSLFSLSKVLNSSASSIIIDHHHPKPEVISSFDHALVCEDAVSTTQIIYYLFKEMKVKFNKEISLPLAAGLLTDSSNFIAATPESFKVFGQLLTLGGLSFQDVIESVAVKMDLSEKIARLKAAQRMKFHKEGKYLIATTKVSSFEGGVAKSMLYLGADVAFAGAEKEGEVRISARATNNVIAKGLHLGRDVLPLVSDLIDGDAGGHAGAAGANGTNPEVIDEAMDICVNATKKILRKT